MKLFVPPVRPTLVARPSLIDKLNRDLQGTIGFARPCTLIAAPAGFGKTTLAIQWLQELGIPTAWLSLDENDNELRRFSTYLIAAMQTIHADLAVDLAANLQLPGPLNLKAIITALINELANCPIRLCLCWMIII
ncbi:MAG: hypothetical protein GY803_30880 [Chloroflexi bacterium]|nr:hypothetical protein [Chloroflexota bacterium]